MANDMRLDVNFVDHPKVKRLIRRAGYEGFYGLIRLFSIAGRLYTDGVFKECEKEDIEDFADWHKEGSLVDILVEVRFMKENDGVFEIHDWEEHQPWIAGSKRRSERAKKAARARWGQSDTAKEDKKPSTAKKKVKQCNKHATSNAKRNAGSNAPLPSPSPSPSPLPSPIPYQSFLDHYNKVCPAIPKATKLTDKRKRAIDAVVKEFGEEGVKEAFSKVEDCPHLIGRNDRGWRADFDWLTNKNNLLKVIEGRYDKIKPAKEATQKSLRDNQSEEYYANDIGW